MDLESTLIRAEQLFRRFQRLVEAVDKKQNFPAPRTRKDSSPPSSSTSASASPRPSENNGKAAEGPAKKTITPELRKLLSRTVDVLPRKVVQSKGDGITVDAT